AMPGSPNSCRRASTSGVITPRFSTMMGRSPNSSRSTENNSAPGALTQRPLTEVVDANEVVQPQGGTQPLDPPLKSGLFEQRPIVNGIPPALSGGTEVVRRDAGNLEGDAAFVEKEELRIRPYIGAVMRHIDRHVADDADIAFAPVSTQFLPLLEEYILEEFLGLDGRSQFFPVAPHGVGLACSNVGVPLGPRDVVVV